MLYHYRTNSSHHLTHSDDAIPISSIEFDYRPNFYKPTTGSKIEQGNLYTNMEKMIEVWKHLDLQEGRHPKMVDVDIIGGGGDINSLDLNIEQLQKISNLSKRKGELKGRSSTSSIESEKKTLPTEDIEKHEDEVDEVEFIQNPNSILRESGWTPMVLQG